MDNYEDRRPRQLEIKRKEHYDQVFNRQPQLMKRIYPLLNESDIIEINTEPNLKFLKKEPILNGKSRVKLRKGVTKFSNRMKDRKSKTSKKISEIRSYVLYGMS